MTYNPQTVSQESLDVIPQSRSAASDYSHPDLSADSPLSKHHPTILTCANSASVAKRVLCPKIDLAPDETAEGLREYCNEVSEWLGLVALGSPRMLQEDTVDPYLSRYEVPRVRKDSVNLAVVNWQGFIPSKWITNLLISCM
jgi:ribonuclease P/MRP protein subunit RPP40